LAGALYPACRVCRSQEGSKFVNPRKGGDTPAAVVALPQLHGRARDALQVRRSLAVSAHMLDTRTARQRHAR
jgi:hypothetical protein